MYQFILSLCPKKFGQISCTNKAIFIFQNLLLNVKICLDLNALKLFILNNI